MKKSIIAAGAASVALAAMPIVGVFASSSTTVSDTITATVSNGCTITRAGTGSTVDRSVAISVATGASQTGDSDAINISCNVGSWTVAAAGTGAGTTSLQTSDGTKSIATGHTFSGGTSEWGMMVTATGGTVATNYNDYYDVPSSTTVVTGSATSGTVTPSYKVYASGTQDTGVYTGEVTYTIAVTD